MKINMKNRKSPDTFVPGLLGEDKYYLILCLSGKGVPDIHSMGRTVGLIQTIQKNLRNTM